jgi:hypothetical protein
VASSRFFRRGRHSVDPEAYDRLHSICSLDHESEPIAGVVSPFGGPCHQAMLADDRSGGCLQCFFLMDRRDRACQNDRRRETLSRFAAIAGSRTWKQR